MKLRFPRIAPNQPAHEALQIEFRHRFILSLRVEEKRPRIPPSLPPPAEPLFSRHSLPTVDRMSACPVP